MKQKIKAGDVVVVIAGNERGERGKVLQVFPQKERLLVEGMNKRKHHEKAKSDQEPGGITERETPLHLSNVMLAARYDKKVGAKAGK
ncbi:MAG: 50S ribosomal protein L24 [Opitutales bacterium]|nr:50S ribosomal protein L24 [Opitutales bacterium]